MTNAVDASGGIGDDIDQLIRMAEAGIKPPKKEETTVTAAAPRNANDSNTANPLTAAGQATDSPLPEKKSKKDKPMKMVYSDNHTSPEEKLARMPRYAFVPVIKAESTGGERGMEEVAVA